MTTLLVLGTILLPCSDLSYLSAMDWWASLLRKLTYTPLRQWGKKKLRIPVLKFYICFTFTSLSLRAEQNYFWLQTRALKGTNFGKNGIATGQQQQEQHQQQGPHNSRSTNNTHDCWKQQGASHSRDANNGGNIRKRRTKHNNMPSAIEETQRTVCILKKLQQQRCQQQ